MQENKRTYQGLIVSIKLYENDVIRTSTVLTQGEVAIEWNSDWSSSWES